MKRFAEIEDGIVVDVALIDPNNVPPHMSNWVLCGDAGVDWLYDGEVFNAPVPPIQAELDAVLSAKYDELERELFDEDIKLKAFALAVLDEINLLRTEHSLTPRTVQQLRTSVRNKMDTL